MSEISLENPPEIPISRHETLTGLTDLASVKQAYWARCINGMDPVSRAPYKRLVANKMNLGDYEDRPGSTSIWEPQSIDEEFNLVLSLCTDGYHRTLIDVDQVTYHKSPLRLPGSGLYGTSAVPSTSHWHIYHHYGSSFQTQVEYLKDNPKYQGHTKRAGYAALRPPWVSKGWAEPVWYRSEFHGFEDADWDVPVPQSDGKMGWEDLFGE